MPWINNITIFCGKIDSIKFTKSALVSSGVSKSRLWTKVKYQRLKLKRDKWDFIFNLTHFSETAMGVKMNAQTTNASFSNWINKWVNEFRKFLLCISKNYVFMKNSINIIEHFQIRCHCQVFLTYDPLKENL